MVLQASVAKQPDACDPGCWRTAGCGGPCDASRHPLSRSLVTDGRLRPAASWALEAPVSVGGAALTGWTARWWSVEPARRCVLRGQG